MGFFFENQFNSTGIELAAASAESSLSFNENSVAALEILGNGGILLGLLTLFVALIFNIDTGNLSEVLKVRIFGLAVAA